MRRLINFIGAIAMAVTTLLPFAAAATSSAVTEARAVLAEKHRDKAIIILLAAIKSEWSSIRRAELEAELQKTTQIFITNEGQRLFESAESARHSGHSGFLANYEAALKLEPQNSKVLASYILALMASKKCKASKEPLSQLEATNPYSEEFKLLNFKFQICSDPSLITTDQESDLEAGKDLQVFKKTVRAQQLILKGQSDQGLALARQANKIDDRYSSAYYWAWKALLKDDSGLDEAQRYLNLCKNVSAETRRKYTWDPDLCTNIEEVDEFLKNEESGKHDQ